VLQEARPRLAASERPGGHDGPAREVSAGTEGANAVRPGALCRRRAAPSGWNRCGWNHAPPVNIVRSRAPAPDPAGLSGVLLVFVAPQRHDDASDGQRGGRNRLSGRPSAWGRVGAGGAGGGGHRGRLRQREWRDRARRGHFQRERASPDDSQGGARVCQWGAVPRGTHRGRGGGRDGLGPAPLGPRAPGIGSGAGPSPRRACTPRSPARPRGAVAAQVEQWFQRRGSAAIGCYRPEWPGLLLGGLEKGTPAPRSGPAGKRARLARPARRGGCGGHAAGARPAGGGAWDYRPGGSSKGNHSSALPAGRPARARPATKNFGQHTVHVGNDTGSAKHASGPGPPAEGA